VAQDPAMICALARHIAADQGARGHHSVRILADAFASLNGRPSERLIDPDVDLAAPLPLRWIMALRR
jgi:hypothetical protein